jgi:hypothetical protein
MVSDAAATGKKELFDTASLGALVKNTRLTSLLEKGKTKVLGTVNWLGDALAHLYWNVDEWTDQYGDSEIGPLEDQLRGLFEELGDTFLRLREKAVETGPDAGILPDTRPSDGGDEALSSAHG